MSFWYSGHNPILFPESGWRASLLLSSSKHDKVMDMGTSLPPHLLEHIAQRFRVLADPTRLRILQLLMDEGESNVGQLVERLALSQANVSKHLRHLLDAGMVIRRAEGTAAYYSVQDPTVVKLCDLVCDRLREQKLEDARTFART
jgi:DNA-binding transcriptional ArsR family regulator